MLLTHKHSKFKKKKAVSFPLSVTTVPINELAPLHGSLGRENTLAYICISRPLIITDHLINSVEEHRHKVDNLLVSVDQGATVRRCAPKHNQSLTQFW